MDGLPLSHPAPYDAGLALRPAAGSRPAVDAEACRRLMQGGSKTFFAASLLLPSSVRAPATALYAFCRVADDAIDERDPAIPVEVALEGLRERLRQIYTGTPEAHEADCALAAVVDRHDLPMPLLDALLEGFAWDAEGRQYETIEALLDYAARVAGTVGALMALVMRTRGTTALERACELGLAMQLTNIARDVGEDARRGRLYLPRQWMREAGLDPDTWLATPRFDEALGSVVARLLAEADRLYARAEHGIAALPRNCRPAIRAARLVYAEIGREVERAGLDSVSRRAVVSRQRKLALVTQALGAALVLPLPVAALNPLPSVRFLVEAARAAPSRRPARGVARPDGNFYERTLWVMDLFENLAERRRPASDNRQRGAHSSAGGLQLEAAE